MESKKSEVGCLLFKSCGALFANSFMWKPLYKSGVVAVAAEAGPGVRLAQSSTAV